MERAFTPDGRETADLDLRLEKVRRKAKPPLGVSTLGARWLQMAEKIRAEGGVDLELSPRSKLRATFAGIEDNEQLNR